MSEEQKEVDPYDLGDTGLLGTAAANTSPGVEEAGQVDSPQPAPALPPRDPETGKFVKPEPKPPAHPAYLVDAARDFGFSEDDIQEMPTDALGRAVNRVRKSQETNRTQMAAERAIVDPQRQPSVPSTGGEAGGGVKTPEADDLGIKEEDYDPEVVKIFRRFHNEIKELRQRLGGVVTHLEQKDNETRTEWADRLFAEHGDDSILGKGTRRVLGEESAELARRNAVVAEAKRIAGPRASADEVIRRIPDALKSLRWSRAEAAPSPPAKEPPEQEGLEERWNRGGLARPTQRSGAKEPKGEELAKRNVARKLKDAGGVDSESPENGEIMDGLLG